MGNLGRVVQAGLSEWEKKPTMAGAGRRALWEKRAAGTGALSQELVE